MQLDGRDTEPSVDRAGLDVDQLHAAVGHDHEPAEEDAARHDEVVLALLHGEVAHLDGRCIKDFATPVTVHTTKGVV